jgi:PadR family transcriptional regulator, regulatory protein PadR
VPDTRHRAHSLQTARVLRALAADAGKWRYGYELGERVGVGSGSLYPILMRLAERGLLEARWESGPPGRPPRHLYRLTGAGRLEAAGLLEPRPAPSARLEPERAR